MDIVCQQCEAVLEAEQDMLGQELSCPVCNTPILVAPSEKAQELPSESSLVKDIFCYNCEAVLEAEQDMLGQQVPCPECGSPLLIAPRVKTHEPSSDSPMVKEHKDSVVDGVLALFFCIIFGVLAAALQAFGVIVVVDIARGMLGMRNRGIDGVGPIIGLVGLFSLFCNLILCGSSLPFLRKFSLFDGFLEDTCKDSSKTERIGCMGLGWVVLIITVLLVWRLLTHRSLLW